MFAAAGASPLFAVEEPLLDEIVVTARKYEENLLRVPMSVQVLSGEFLDESDITSLYDLQFAVPGLVVASTGMFGPVLTLRGITNESATGQSVATHMNGVFLGRADQSLARMFDVERVEVLKGPQGTLYGRNSSAGAVNILSRIPEHEFGASFEAATGNYATTRIEGQVNVPVGAYALRVAGTASDSDGIIRNTADDRRFAEDDYRGLRMFFSGALTPAVDLRLMAQRVIDDGAAYDLWLPAKSHMPDPNDPHLTTVTDPNPFLHLQNDLVSADITWSFDGAWLQSVTGYARNVTTARDDCEGSPELPNCVRGLDPWTFEQWSQEFRLASAQGSGIEWIVGANFFNGREFRNYYFELGQPEPVLLSDYTADADENAWGAFGQATWRLGSGFSLTTGLRYSVERYAIEDADDAVNDSPPASADDQWDDTSWRLGLQYEPDEWTLWYTSLATGFKSGGISTERLSNGDYLGYLPETVLTWELGVKRRSAVASRSVAANVFYNEFEDLQVQTLGIVDGELLFFIDNVPAARVYGMEGVAEAAVGKHWTVAVTVSWIPERHFIEDYVSLDGSSIEGNVLSRAPEWSAGANVEYRSPPVAGGNLYARLDYSYRSAVFYTKENRPQASQGAFSLFNTYVRFERPESRWYLFASARNLFDEHYFNQVLLQSSAGWPSTWEVGFGLRY